MKVRHPRTELSLLRAKLKRKGSKRQVLKVSSPLAATPRPFSRDVSHIRDQRLAVRADSRGDLLLRTLSPHLSLESSPEVKNFSRLAADLSLDSRLSEALSQFESTENSLEGFLAYKAHTSSVLEVLQTVYHCKLPPVTARAESLTGFHPATPTSRREVELLNHWLSSVLKLYVTDQAQPVCEKAKAFQVILRTALSELIRQVSVQCAERGQLLEKVVGALASVEDLAESKCKTQLVELQQQLSALESNAKVHLNKKLGQAKTMQSELKKALESKHSELEIVLEQNRQLDSDLKVLRKRVNFLQDTQQTQRPQDSENFYKFMRKSTVRVTLKKHAETNTQDADFLEVSKFEPTFHPKLNQPLLLVGSFQRRGIFHKTAAYVPREGKVVPYDFPVESIALRTTQTVGTATVESLDEIMSKEYVQLSPNRIKEIDTEDIVHYSNTVPFTMIAGLYSLALTRSVVITSNKLTQCMKPFLLIEQNQEVKVIPKKARRKRLRTNKKRVVQKQVACEASNTERGLLTVTDFNISIDSSLHSSYRSNSPYDSNHSRLVTVVSPTSEVSIYSESAQNENKSTQVDTTPGFIPLESPAPRRRNQSVSPNRFRQFTRLTKSIPEQQSVVFPDDSEPAVLKTTLPNCPATHFLRGFLTSIASGTRLHSPMTVRQILKVIQQTYATAAQGLKDYSKSKTAASALHFVLLKMYGLKSVAEQKLKHVVLGCLVYRSENLRIQNFARFLGLSETQAPEEFLCYLALHEQVHGYPLNKDHITDHFIVNEELLAFVESVFYGQIDVFQYLALLQELKALRQEEVSTAAIRRVVVEKVDIDRAFSACYSYLPVAIKAVQAKLSTVAETTDLLPQEVCMKIGQELAADPQDLQSFFTNLKQVEDGAEVLPQNTLCWYLIQNKLL